MKKKDIEKVPYRTVQAAEVAYPYVAAAFLHEIKGEPHLFVELYKNEEGSFQIPEVRMIFTQNDWILYYPENDLWSEAGPGSVKDKMQERYTGKLKAFLPEDEENMIWNFHDMGKSRYYKWPYVLESLVNHIKARREARRNEKRKRKLKERADNTPPLPDDLEEWTEKRLFNQEHFLYYKRHGRYADIACSACGQVTEIATKRVETFVGQFEKIVIPRNNEQGVCPNCGVHGTFKAQGKMKGVYALGKHCFVAQPYKENGVVVRYIHTEKIYRMDTSLEENRETMTGAGERLSITEISRTYLEKGKDPQTDYHKYSSFSGNFWDDCNLGGMSNISIHPALIYEKSYQALQNSFLRYSAAGLYGKQVRTYNLRDYLLRYMEWPQIEMLVKMGLYGVVDNMIKGYCGLIRLSHSKNPEEFLGIYKSRLRDLRKIQGDVEYLRTWQKEKRNGLRLTEKESVFLATTDPAAADLELALTCTTMIKLINKIEKYTGCQIPEHIGETWSECAEDNIRRITRLWFDYIHMRSDRGYNLRNQIFLFPRDLNRAHAQMVLETNKAKMEQRGKEADERFPKIKENYRRLRNSYFFEDDKYLIRPARTAREIVEEGCILHHCVGGNNYLNKHNNGESTILFLRKQENPKEPYITVEIRNDRILQWYGIKDTKPDKENIEKWLYKYTEMLTMKFEAATA